VATLFSDGFESGNLSAWTASGASAGCSKTVGQAYAFFGSYGLRTYKDACPPANQVYLYKSFTGQSAAWMRGYLKVLSCAGNTNEVLFVLGFSRWGYLHADSASCAVGVKKTAAGQKLELYYMKNGAIATLPASPYALTTSQKYLVEVYQKHAGGAAGQGQVQLYVNGVLVASDSGYTAPFYNLGVFWLLNDDYGPAQWPFLMTGMSGAAEVWFDEGAVATTRPEAVRGFRIYHNAGVGPTDYDTVEASVSEYASDWTSGALSYPATYRFGVRAYNEYGEEKNLDVAEELALLESGEESPARPNRPTNLAASPAASGKVELAFSYDSTEEGAVCTHFHIYDDAGSGQVDYGTPVGTVAKDDGPVTHYVFLSGALTSGVTYRFAVRAASASDVEDDGIESVAVTADADPPNQPASLSAQVVR